MSRLFPVLGLCVLGCSVEAVDTDTATDEGPLQMGEIHGVVTRSAELQGDGLGNVIVLAFYGVNPALDRSPHNVLVLPYEDLREPGTEVPYRLHNLFPEPEPYTVLAVFDDDDSLLDSMNWTPTEGDLLSTALGSDEFPEVVVGADEGCELTLELSVIYAD